MNVADLLESVRKFTSGETGFPEPGDWFERFDEIALSAAMNRDPDGTRGALRATLGIDRTARIIDAVTRGRDLAEEGVAPPVDPRLPEILLLPGFMGVHLLGADGARVWLDPAALLRGNIAERTRLDESGTGETYPGQRIQPDGLIRLVYADLAWELRLNGFAVHPFSFDFRRSLIGAARELAALLGDLARVSPEKRFILVGHSMGANLACLVPYYFPAWRERIEQVILLGAPFGGTFDPVEALAGSHWVTRKLPLFDRHDDAHELELTLRTWPGLYSMLPDLATYPEAEDVFEASLWPAGVEPPPPMLAEARGLKEALRQSPFFGVKPVSHLFSDDFPTVASLDRLDGRLVAGPRIYKGDSVVAGRAALVPGVAGYHTHFPHTLGPVEPAAIRAVVDLACGGTCSLDPIAPGDLEGEVSVAASGIYAFANDPVETLRQGILSIEAASWLFSSLT